MAQEPDSNALYVADAGNHILQITPDGDVKMFFDLRKASETLRGREEKERLITDMAVRNNILILKSQANLFRLAPST